MTGAADRLDTAEASARLRTIRAASRVRIGRKNNTTTFTYQ